MKKIFSYLSFIVPVILILTVMVYFAPNAPEQPGSSALPEANDSGSAPASSDYYGEINLPAKEGLVNPGYILYPSVGDYQVRILNHGGRVLHSWPVDAMRARLLPEENCALLVIHGSKAGQEHAKWGGLSNTIRKYDWEGNVIWEYTADQRIHHDIRLTAAQNYLFPVKEMLNADMFRRYRDIPRDIFEIKSDRLIVLNKDKEIIWDWSAHEHLPMDSCGRMHCDKTHNVSGWTHLNTVSELPENKWFDDGDQRFKPGNIMIMLRNWWQALIIDKDSKQVVWTYGGDYRGGLSGGHEAVMIEKGLPGAGNILVFDNGRMNHKGESIVLEVEPPTSEIVWKYEDGKKFFSHSAGSAQRLANGNTFISQDANGFRAFEVSPGKEIVWELQGELRTSRVHKYPVDYCPQFGGFAGSFD